LAVLDVFFWLDSKLKGDERPNSKHTPNQKHIEFETHPEPKTHQIRTQLEPETHRIRNTAYSLKFSYLFTIPHSSAYDVTLQCCCYLLTYN